jgi:hypothetical protein
MLALILCLASTGGDPGPVDFTKVERSIAKPPADLGPEPLYGLFLFGPKGEKRVWAILDRSARTEGDYDLLYLDLDADGDLTEPGERISGGAVEEEWRGRSRFQVAELRDPAGSAVHRDFELTWAPERVRFSMRWHGKARTLGGYGPTSEDICTFGPSPTSAPIFVPGWDLPFQFETWWGGEERPMERGKENDFKVFIGNAGSGRGTFTCVDDKFLAKQEYVLAQLSYTSPSGRKQTEPAELRQRC